jgi:hypothetical protein
LAAADEETRETEENFEEYYEAELRKDGGLFDDGSTNARKP